MTAPSFPGSVRSRSSLALLAMLALFGCDESKASDTAAVPSPSDTATATAPQHATKPEKNDLVTVDLAPLPLQAAVAPGGMGAMDMSMDDRKSVTLDIGDGKSLNISEVQEDFAAVKKSYENDTIMFPFKKWVKEEKDLAIAQFDNSGKTGYVGFSLKQIGGKNYVCKTTGLDGVASPEEAESQLAQCSSLRAK